MLLKNNRSVRCARLPGRVSGLGSARASDVAATAAPLLFEFVRGEGTQNRSGRMGVLSREGASMRRTVLAALRRDIVTHDRPHQIKGKVTSAAIVRRVDLTPEHFKIWLRSAEPFPFEPGQYCTVGVDGVERPYSIVSSPREPLLELFVELIPPPLGHLTPLLHALKVGDTVTLRPRAKGVFLLRPEFRNHVMVSTVTGRRAVRQHVALLARGRRRRPAHVRARRCELLRRVRLRRGAARLWPSATAKCASCRRARGPAIRATWGGRGKSGACTRSSRIMSASGRSSPPRLASTPAAIRR